MRNIFSSGSLRDLIVTRSTTIVYVLMVDSTENMFLRKSQRYKGCMCHCVWPYNSCAFDIGTHCDIVECCPVTKLNGGLSRLHSVDEDAVSWFMTRIREKEDYDYC